MRSLFLFLVAGPLLLFARTASAGELTYEAPAGCPNRADVAGRAARRAPEGRDARVTIRKKASGYAAHLSIGGGDDTLERDVEGRSCDAVVDAALLVLALDHPPEPPEPPEPPPPVAPVMVAPAAVPPVAAPPEPRAPLSFAVGLDAELRALSYDAVVGGTLFGELGAPDLFGWKRYRPSARLGASVLSSKHGDAHFFGGGLQLCPIGGALVARASTELTLAACAAFDVGGARDIFTGVWADVGGIARTTLQLGRPGSMRWFMDLSIGIFTRIDTSSTTTSVSGGAINTTAVSSSAPVSFTYPLSSGALGRVDLGFGIVFP